MGPRSQAHRLVDVLGPPKSPVPSVSIGVYPWLNSFPSALIRFNHTLLHASSSSILPSACPVLGPAGHSSRRRHQIIRRMVQITRRQVRMAGRRLSIARRRVHFANLAGRMADLTGQISSRKIHFSDGVSHPWIGRDISPISQHRSCHSPFISLG